MGSDILAKITKEAYDKMDHSEYIDVMNNLCGYEIIKKPIGNIYHYCNISVLKEILDSKKLWLSDALK